MAYKMDVSVVVPAFNEQLLIGKFLTDVDDTCKKLGLKYEIIIVENGSTDDTWDIIRKLSKKLQNIKAYQLPDPRYGEALFLGMMKAEGKFITIFNVDFWDKKLLAITKADLLGYDIVVGSKLLLGSCDTRRLGRRVITWIFAKFLKIFLQYCGTDTHGVKVMRSDKIIPVIKLCKTKSGIFDSEFMLRACRKNLKILELPVQVTDVRPVRFSFWRILQTPVDIWNLYKALL